MHFKVWETSSFPYETDKIQENSHLEISASAPRQWHRHRIRNENRKCFVKISRRKFPDNLKGATVQNLCGKISVVESFLVKLQE